MKSLAKVWSRRGFGGLGALVALGLSLLVAPSGALGAEAGIARQAGARGPDNAAYGRAGGIQVGAALGARFGAEEPAATVTPSVGLFLTDNLQLSALLGYAQGNDLGIYSAVLEPSIHLPLAAGVFGYAGVGAGVNHVSSQGTGFLLAPRIGASFLIGRVGVLSPSLVLSYAASDLVSERRGDGTRLALGTAIGANLGYTLMW